MTRFITIAISIICFYVSGISQEGYSYNENIRALYSTVFNGDTIPYVHIPDVVIVSHPLSTSERIEYERIKKKVEKVYPYYLISKEVVFEMEEKKENLKKKKYKKYKKQRKEELMNEFEKELKDLRVSEGKILVKMINRDTGMPFYDLIKEYNSNFKAWVYNLAAKKYGYDLKSAYDPEDPENRYLEMALTSLEAEQQILTTD